MTVNFTPHSKMISRQHELGKAIIPFLVDRYHPKSLIEFGCGPGEFLRMFKDSISTSDYLGIDGTDYGKNQKLKNFIKFDIPAIFYMPLTERKRDIVICLEVIEHLKDIDGKILIENMCKIAGKAILFSGAIPGQGGDNHINERPHFYWHEKFNKLGWKCFDIIRPIIKDNKNVPFWYRNNIFIYEKIRQE